MALYDSADLLARCKLHARRPATDQAMTDPNWYSFLTEAQPEVHSDLFTRYPDLAYGAPLLLTSADGGFTYTFGLDAAGDPIRPMGHAEIYPNLRAIPDSPLIIGEDYLFEGSLIRTLGNRAKTWANGPYARLVIRPDAAISAAAQPVLVPKSARMLYVWLALEAWAARPGSGVSPDHYRQRYEENKVAVWTALATSYNRQGAQAAGSDEGTWYDSIDLGASGLNI
jgi:hypothetical protein